GINLRAHGQDRFAPPMPGSAEEPDTRGHTASIDASADREHASACQSPHHPDMRKASIWIVCTSRCNLDSSATSACMAVLNAQTQFWPNFSDIFAKALSQSVATSCNARFHCPKRDLGNISDLFVRKILDIAEDNCRPIWLGNFSEFTFDPRLDFMIGHSIEWRLTMIDERQVDFRWGAVLQISVGLLDRCFF